MVFYSNDDARWLDVTLLIQRFGIAAEEWMFEEITRATAKADLRPEIPGVTVSQVIAIHRLLDPEATFEEADAQEAHLWMTDAFPELMDTGTLTPESILKYAADLRGRGGDGACEDFSNLRKDLGDFLLEDALYPEDDPTEIDTGDTRAEQREWLRRFMNEDTTPLWPIVRDAPKDHRVWLRKNLDLVDFMVDDQIHSGMTVRQRYGADVYAANCCRLWEEVGQPACDKPGKELMRQAVGVAAREIIATCDGVVAKMEPYIEELKAAIKDLNEELRVPRYVCL